MITSLLVFTLFVVVALYLCSNPSNATITEISNHHNKKKSLISHILKLLVAFIAYCFIIYALVMAFMVGSIFVIIAYQKLLAVVSISYDYESFLMFAETIALVITLVLAAVNVRTIECIANQLTKKREKSLSLFALCKGDS
ncbi:hypothetical protein [Cysteiniphilum marinum]|uniref:hypothetical protein n=1 Tax=Cysteiniphilum marinum TaxID=2774191 RepID=UPI00193C21F8|nr:hypothetical protein [Cysteiniphilum marinum]